MKIKKIAIVLFLLTGIFYSTPSYPYGLITHIGQAQDIIDKAKAGDPSVPADIAAVITKSPATEKAFRSGALDGDIFNALPFNTVLARTSHEKCSASIASALLKNAKTDEEKAYAYGWAFVHLPGDVIGHGKWVNDIVGKKWNYDESSFSGTNELHKNTEKRGDWYTLNKYGFDEYEAEDGIIKQPRLKLDIDLPVRMLRKSIAEAYGLSATSPSVLYEEIAELAIQTFLYLRADSLAYSQYPDDQNFSNKYTDTMVEIETWMKNRSLVNENFNLDDGTKQSKDNCQLPPQALQIPSPGGDHPDETYDVATLQAMGEVTFSDWLKIAIKNGKTGALFFYQLKNKLNEFKILPADIDPVVREQKRKELIDFYKANVNNPDIVEAFRESNPSLIEDLSTVEDIAILNNGYSYNTASLIAKFKEPTVKILPDFTLDLIKEKKVLIIPSGGLYGLDNSEFFKVSLDEYVRQGGTLIVFAQQHGYEFSVLPVPQEADGSYKTITGYGWTGDQSCFTNAAYIDTWHQILSGQSRSTPTLNIDGYFTNYPSNSTVLLRRTANGQPAMLMYDYGFGKVIVTSMYSDFAYGHGQAALEEKALVRDMVSWAKAPAELPEVKPGQTVSVAVSVKNNTATDAISVKLYIYSPDRTTVISEQLSVISVSAGQSATIPVTYTSTLTSTLGIYHIDYELYDSNGIIIQPQAETDSGRFVVSNPPRDPYQESGLDISVTTPSEYILPNQDVPFTVTLWNNTDKEERIRLYAGWDHIPRTFLDEVLVPAKGSISNNYTIPNPESGRSLWIDVFSKSGLQIRSKAMYHFTDDPWTYAGSYGKGFNLIYPSVDVTIQTDKALYSRGDPVNLNLNLKNRQNLGYTTSLKIRVIDPSNMSIYNNSLDINLPANGTSTQNLSFVLSSTAQYGYHTVLTEAYDTSGRKIGGDSASFNVPSAILSITPALPDTLNTNSTFQPSFDVKNIWITDVPNATLKINFTAPNSNTLFTNTESFSISAGQTKTFSYNISTGPAVSGDYTINYSLSYDEKIVFGRKKFTRQYIVKNIFDKTTYSAGDTINTIINITNNGLFEDSLLLEVSIPEFSYTESTNIFVPSGQSLDKPFSIPVPLDALTGKHSMLVSLGGAEKTFNFYIPQSKLELSIPQAGNNAGDNIIINIANTGGGGTSYNLTARLIDKYGVSAKEQNFTNALSANTSKNEIFTIPKGALTGDYRLIISITDTVTGKITSLLESLTITGVSATLNVTTDKIIYLLSESHLSISTIVSTGMSVSDASLELKVVPPITTGTVSGYVTDAETSSHLSGAKITVGSKAGYSSANGVYRIVDVPLGTHTIKAEYPGYDISSAQIEVVEGTQEYNFWLLKSKFGNLNGVVKDSETDSLIVGAKIELTPKNVVSEEQISRIAHSGFDGNFEIVKQAVGLYTLKITKDGYNTLETEVQIAEGTNQKQFILNKIPVIVPPPTLGELTGNVKDGATGTILLGVNVVLDGTVSDRVPEFEQKYHFKDITPGTNTLSINHAGYDIFETTIEIAAGEQNYNILLTPSLYRNLTGAIKDASTGNLIIGAKIEITPQNVASSDQFSKILHSDFNGAYSLVKFPVGTYSVKIIKQYYSELNTTVVIQQGDITFDINLSQSEPIPSISETEPNNTLAQGTPLPIDATGSGTIYPTGDIDYYKINIPSKGTVKITLSDIPSGQYYWIRLWTNTGTVIASTGYVASPGPAVLSKFLDNAGDYYIDVFSMSGYSSTSPYKIKVEFIPLDEDTYTYNEPNNSIATATMLPLDTTELGYMYPEQDSDYYKINVPTKGTIKVTLNDIPSGRTYWIRLWTSSGTVIGSSGYVAGPGSAIVSKFLDNAGDYYIDVSSANGWSSTSPYRIKAEFIPLDEDTYTYNEPNNSIATATMLPLDTTELGYMYPEQDSDYYKINVPTKGTIKVTLSDIPSGRTYWIRLWTSSGTVIGSSGYVTGPGSAIVSKFLDNGGDYYIDVLSGNGWSSTSPYRIKAEFVPLDEDIYTYNEPNNGFSTATLLLLDTIEIGYIYPEQDPDFYRITVPAKGTVKVTLNDIPSGRSYLVRLWTSSGTVIGSSGYVTGPGSAIVSKFLDNGGDYYIDVLSGNGWSSTSPYRIYATFSPDSLLTEQIIFEKTISPVNLMGSQTINENIPAIGIAGKYLLTGVLKSSTSQTITTSEYPFYIIQGNTVLLFNTDKKVYKPNEPVTITGEVKNLASITASALSLQLSANSQNLYTATFDIPANGSYLFTVTTTAGTEGTYTLTGKVTQNNSTLVEITDQYEVVGSQVSVIVSAPEVAGNEPFNIDVELNNEGKIEAVVSLQSSVDSQIQSITIPAGETSLIQYSQQITSDTTYTFTFTGDINQTITKTVSYGLATFIAINPQATYPEGTVAIPVTITNTGQLDEVLTVDFRLQPSDLIQTKTYYIPKGGNVTDTLYFDLTEGEYQLTANSQLPSASAQANFSVKKDIKVDMNVSVGAQSNSLIPVTVNLTNIGYSEISGSVSVSVSPSTGSRQGTVVWNGEQAVSLPSNPQSPTPNPYLFNINPSSIESGDYTVKVELLDNSGQSLGVQSLELRVNEASFQITQLPSYQTFTIGQEATFTFTVKNTGNQEGAVELSFNAYDLIDSSQTEWLSPQEEKSITFSFILPDDLEEKDYFAEYRLGDTIKGQVKYHVSGINLNVNATLDKQYYSEGETAHLTIAVSSQQSVVSTLNLFARVNYAGYESQQSFTLNGSQTLTFDIPLTQITGEKLFYGIYYESGRSIHLNSLYIYKAEDIITITTDKQVYNPGETVLIGVSDQGSGVSGTMTLSAPNYTETFEFSGSATKSFILPSTMTAGTYFINAELLTLNSELITASHPFDVAGISVKVKEATLDKSKYASTDTLKLTLTIESNRDMPATLKTWIVDPEGKYTGAGESNINLLSSEPLLFTNNYSLSTVVSGIHRLVYGIYSGDLLLVSGSEAFDVGYAVFLGLSTDKTDYPTNTEPVTATISAYGTIDATLELQLNGTTVMSQSVSLNGVVTLNVQLGTMQPGTHTLKAILTAGGLKSTKETTFTYALSLLDSDSDGIPDQWEKTNNLNPNDPSDALLDSDNDGLTNLQEYQNSTNPNSSDTDNDQMPDGWEVTYGLNPNINDASSDKDNDGYTNLEEYQKGSNPSDPSSIPNQPPIANAGDDRNVVTGETFTLNGSESYDPEGAMITFLWRFVQVPVGSSITDASLSDITDAKPTFIPDVDGNYKLKLVVNDGQMDSSPDEAIIISATPNVAPNANAGPDQNVYTGTVVNLNGSESYDPDNKPQPLSYLWSFVSVPQGSALTDNDITDRTYAIAGFTPDVDGDYVIRLIVSDGDLSSNGSVVIISTRPNIPPNANAGADITIYLSQTAMLDGSLSNDPDNGPQPLTYSWGFVAVPTSSSITNSNLSNADTVSPSFTPDVVGTYVLELMISDNKDYSFDNVGITVVYSSPDPNFFLPPIENNRVFKLNSTIPVKFQLTDSKGDYISTAVAKLMLQKYSNNEPIGTPVEAVSSGRANSGNLFRYDSIDNLYIFNLSTKNLSKGTWQLRVLLDDGTTKTVFIELR